MTYRQSITKNEMNHIRGDSHLTRRDLNRRQDDTSVRQVVGGSRWMSGLNRWWFHLTGVRTNEQTPKT